MTATNEIANPSGWGNALEVSFDPTTGILSLTADGNNSYQTITVASDNLSFDNGQVITGIIPITLNSAVSPDTAAPTVSTSFTANAFGALASAGHPFSCRGFFNPRQRREISAEPRNEVIHNIAMGQLGIVANVNNQKISDLL